MRKEIAKWQKPKDFDILLCLNSNICPFSGDLIMMQTTLTSEDKMSFRKKRLTERHCENFKILRLLPFSHAASIQNFVRFRRFDLMQTLIRVPLISPAFIPDKVTGFDCVRQFPDGYATFMCGPVRYDRPSSRKRAFFTRFQPQMVNRTDFHLETHYRANSCTGGYPKVDINRL